MRWRGSTVEQLICNQQVGGSIPSASSKKGRKRTRKGSSAERKSGGLSNSEMSESQRSSDEGRQARSGCVIPSASSKKFLSKKLKKVLDIY